MSAIQAAPHLDRHALDPAWTGIPRLAATLLWRHWPALLFWFFAQRLAHELLMALAIRLSSFGLVLSYAVVAALVVAQLAGTIAMFLVLRPSLPALALALAPAHGSGPGHVVRPWLNAMAIALLPFFAYYATWGLLDNVRRAFLTGYLFGASFEGRENLQDVFALRGIWIALAAAAVLRHVAKRRVAATGRGGWSVLATLCEAYWVFVGVAAVARGMGWLKDWWHARAVYVAVSQWWSNPLPDAGFLAPARRMLQPVLDLVSTAAGAMLMPLVWLAITAIIYGFDLRRRQRLGVADAPFRLLSSRYKGLHFIWKKLAGKLSSGWAGKGVPVVNSLRLVLRAGLPAMLALCLGWQLLASLDASLFRFTALLIGPRDDWEWRLIGVPLSVFVNGPASLRPALLTELPRVCLLAATFGYVATRLPAAMRAAASGAQSVDEDSGKRR